MQEHRQRLLVLYLANSTPSSSVIGWSEYNGNSDTNFEASGDQIKPYQTCLEAMRDGWRVIRFPYLQNPSKGNEYDKGYLEFEFILEKWEPKNV